VAGTLKNTINIGIIFWKYLPVLVNRIVEEVTSYLYSTNFYDLLTFYL